MPAQIRKHEVFPFCQTIFEGKKGFLLDIRPIVLDSKYRKTLGLYSWYGVEPSTKEGAFDLNHWAVDLPKLISKTLYDFDAKSRAVVFGSLEPWHLNHPFEVTLVNREWRDDFEAAYDLKIGLKRRRPNLEKDPNWKSLGKKLGFFHERIFEWSVWEVTNSALWRSPETALAVTGLP